MEDFVERKAFEVANFEPENGFHLVIHKKVIDELKNGNGKKLKEIVFRKPFAGVRVEAEKIQVTKANPIPEFRPNQRAMFERGDIMILNRDFRESINIAPGMRVKTFLKFKGKK